MRKWILVAGPVWTGDTKTNQVGHRIPTQPAPHLLFQAAAKLAGLEQTEIADYILKSPATVSRYLSGDRFPRDLDLARLCALLGLDQVHVRKLHEAEAYALAHPNRVVPQTPEELNNAIRLSLPARPQNWAKDPLWARHIEDALDPEKLLDLSSSAAGSIAELLAVLPRVPAPPGRWRQASDAKIGWELKAAAAAGIPDPVLDLASDLLAAPRADGAETPRERVQRAISEASEAVAFYQKKQ